MHLLLAATGRILLYPNDLDDAFCNSVPVIMFGLLGVLCGPLLLPVATSET